MTRQLGIEFAGTRLTVRTNDPSIEQHLRDAYEFMLVASDRSTEKPTPVLDLFRDESLPPELLPFVEGEVYRRFIGVRPDLLWLHAGVVARDGTALVIGGASGQGKSTLTTMLCETGWEYLSDDLAPIDIDARLVMPFPRSPRRRVFPGRHIEPDEVHTLARERVPLRSGAVRREPAPIQRFVFLDFERGAAARIVSLRQGDAALAIVASCMNFPEHRGVAVDVATELGRSLPAHRLVYGHAVDALEAALSLA